MTTLEIENLKQDIQYVYDTLKGDKELQKRIAWGVLDLKVSYRWFMRMMAGTFRGQETLALQSEEEQELWADRLDKIKKYLIVNGHMIDIEKYKRKPKREVIQSGFSGVHEVRL